ncbi:hypothetical protein [Streptomyces sp. NPDC005336]|uniref:hypothetical protein n=1 Tax=unclassified Streptomyces TaxID=2593676 RepID=UPI0033BD0431
MITLATLGGALALVMGFLALLVLGSQDSDARPSALDRAEQRAHLYPDQNPQAGRYYIPDAGRSTEHTAYLRYRILGGQDSNPKDFCRAYRITGPGRTDAPIPRDVADGLGATVPARADIAFTDRDGGVRRELYAVYAGPDGGSSDAERFGEAGARVFVRAQTS